MNYGGRHAAHVHQDAAYRDCSTCHSAWVYKSRESRLKFGTNETPTVCAI